MQTRKLGRAAITTVLASSIGAFAQAAPQPDLSGNDPHWIKLTVEGQDCRTFDPNPVPGEHVTWTGGCSNRLTSGPGTTTWYRPDGTISGTATGTMVNGYLEGQVVQERTENGLRHHDIQQFLHGIANGYSVLESYDSQGRIVQRSKGYFINSVANGPVSETLYRSDGTISRQYNGQIVNGKVVSGQWVVPQTAANAPTSPEKSNSRQPVQRVFDSASKASFTFMGIKLGAPMAASMPVCPADTKEDQICYRDKNNIVRPNNIPDIGLAYLIDISTLYNNSKNPIYAIEMDFLEGSYSDVIAMFTEKYSKPTREDKVDIDVNGEVESYMSPVWDFGKAKIVIFQQYINNGFFPVVQIIDKKFNAMQEADIARQKEKQIQSGASKF